MPSEHKQTVPTQPEHLSTKRNKYAPTKKSGFPHRHYTDDFFPSTTSQDTVQFCGYPPTPACTVPMAQQVMLTGLHKKELNGAGAFLYEYNEKAKRFVVAFIEERKRLLVKPQNITAPLHLGSSESSSVQTDSEEDEGV